MEINTQSKTPKPWGHELLLALNEYYALKSITVNENCRTSLQSHVSKVESVFVVDGRMLLEAGPSADELGEFEFGPGDSYTLVAGEVHRVTGITDVIYLEASSPHLDDVVRYVDDYGRAAESAD